MTNDSKFIGTPFYGDGRKKVQPNSRPLGTNPRCIGRATARRIIEKFLEVGESHHSSFGETIWVVVEYCASKGIKFKRVDQSIIMEKSNGN